MFQTVLFLFCTISSGNAKLNTSIALDFKSNLLNAILQKANNVEEESPKLVNLPGTTFNHVKYHLSKTMTKSVLETQTTPSVGNPVSLNTTFIKNSIISINETERLRVLHRIHATITRSKDAVWATITLTFMCVILVLAVAQSRMWKDFKGTESQGVPLPNFNERVLFRDVMERRMNSLKEIFKKKTTKRTVSELESLLPTTDWELKSNEEVY